MKILNNDKLTIALGSIISISLFILTFNYEVEKDRLYFLSSATSIFNKIESTFSTLNRINKEFASRFYLADELNKDEFIFFAQSHIAHNPFIEKILFSEKVLRTEKQQYESTLKDEGYSGFQIKPFPETTFADSIYSDFLFPIKYIEPYNVKNSRWFGLDILTHPIISTAILSTTRHPRQLTYTPIPKEPNKLYTVRALYSGNQGHISSKGLRDVFGTLIYKIDLNDLLMNNNADLIEISLNNQLLLQNHPTPSKGLFDTTFKKSTEISLDGQTLQIKLWRTQDILSADSTFPLIILLLGLTSTLFVWHIIHSHVKINKLLSKQNDVIENEVQEKTGELRRKANELSTAYNRQLELTDELEAFCYSVSHDLKAPLRSINGFSQILHDDYSEILDEEAKNYLIRTSTAAGKMGNIIDDLLSLSRITRSNLKMQNINLSELVKRSVQVMQEYQPDRQVTVDIQENISANGDPRLLQIAIENLVSNAWKYSEKNIDAHMEFGTTTKNEESVYYIRDNGAGFDMKYISKLFIAFQRLHHPSEFEGTGIGLATVQRIIQKHNGRIWAESEPGKGATFYFTLTTVRQKPKKEEDTKLARH